MFEHYDHLSFTNPYYMLVGDSFVVGSKLADVAAHVRGPKEIDSTALVEVISRYHCFADRTLIKGVYRSPWMAKLTSDRTDWVFADLPPHGNSVMPEAAIAKRLFAKLQTEILRYCDGCSTVGLLLSGGMDSRIAAGVLDYLLRTRQISVDVVAITWGMEQTRDVLYAQEVALRLGWDWVHFPITANDLLSNITETAQRGCEYSPVHLHAMPRVRDIEGLGCILAASYGDSVGRAEYSGRHITQLVPFERYTMNWFKLLRADAYQEAARSIALDVGRYRTLFPRATELQHHEVDQQAHYMRRKLNPCMSVIDEKIPLLQVFTSPDVFGFVWSLSPQVRNNEVYRHLVALLQTELSDIPWARTGKPYLALGGPLDGYPAVHHRYGEWIRGELYPIIKDKLLSSAIDSLSVFNMQALESALEANRRLARQVSATKMDEVAIWIAALSDFVEMYGVQGSSTERTFVDRINGAIVSPLQVAGLATMKSVLSRR